MHKSLDNHISIMVLSLIAPLLLIYLMSKTEKINHHSDLNFFGGIAYKLIAITEEDKNVGNKTDDLNISYQPSLRSPSESSQPKLQFK